MSFQLNTEDLLVYPYPYLQSNLAVWNGKQCIAYELPDSSTPKQPPVKLSGAFSSHQTAACGHM